MRMSSSSARSSDRRGPIPLMYWRGSVRTSRRSVSVETGVSAIGTLSVGSAGVCCVEISVF